jgi:hypothetical protein
MPGTGTQAFGTGPKSEGVVVTPADLLAAQQPVESIAKDIHAIRERYVLQNGIYAVQFTLAASRAMKIDLSQSINNAFTLTVTTGGVNLWFGDYSSVDRQTGSIPHLLLSAAIVPQSQVFAVPPGNYVITLQAFDTGAVTGYLLAMAL